MSRRKYMLVACTVHVHVLGAGSTVDCGWWQFSVELSLMRAGLRVTRCVRGLECERDTEASRQ